MRKNEGISILAFFAIVLLSLTATMGDTRAATAQKAPPQPKKIITLTVFIEYRELGAHDVYVITEAGERLEVNQFMARDGVTFEGYGGLDTNNNTVWVFSR